MDDDELAQAFRLFARGVADRRSAFHTPSVATAGADGAPRIRTVVLRSCDAAGRTLGFHTDLRAAKVGQLRADPAVALHVYDSGLRIQVRARGLAALHHEDEVTRAAWRAASPSSRDTYRVSQGPGSVVPGPEAVDPLGLGHEDAYARFVAVRVTVTELEWLHLASAGHRRVRFTWPDGAAIREQLVP